MSSVLPAFANLRAPSIRYQAPSTELYTGNEALTVLREDLHFSCTIDRSDFPSESICYVTAMYEIESEEHIDADLQFIGPTAGELEWSLQIMESDSSQLFDSGSTHLQHEANAVDLPADLTRLFSGEDVYSLPADELYGRYDRDGNPVVQLYRADFPVSFQRGTNLLQISYTHVPGFFEYNYGYFTSSQFEFSLGYEVWPLKQWRLDEEFELSIQVELTNAVAGWWSRLRNRNDVIWITDSSAARIEETRAERQKGALRYQWSFFRDQLPDRIQIHIAPANRLTE